MTQLHVAGSYYQFIIRSNLYIMALYIVLTLYITITRQLPKISSCLIIIFCKFDLYIAITLLLPKGDRCTQVSL